jgi:hypothetical protein
MGGDEFVVYLGDYLLMNGIKVMPSLLLTISMLIAACPMITVSGPDPVLPASLLLSCCGILFRQSRYSIEAIIQIAGSVLSPLATH